MYRLHVRRDPMTRVAARWFRDRGDTTLRLEYPLDARSVVLDVGGYLGDWADAIARRYDPHIHVFEPVPEFHANLVRRFRGNPKIRVWDFGLFDRTASESMSITGDGSSLFGGGSRRIEVRLKDVWEFIEESDIESVDLIKINIEGAEYALLKRMLDTRMVERCRDIQVQFHDFVPDAVRMREEIRGRLRATHEPTYDYPFVWENWRRRGAGPGGVT
jgi:FkbM family methyltransferase